MQLIESTTPAMEVESGLNCSCPVTMQHAAERVVVHATSILRELETPNSNDEDALTQAGAILR